MAHRSPTLRENLRRLFRFLRWPALVLLLAWAGLAGLLDHFGQTDRARPADAIVVLGARVTPQGVPGDSLRGRTLAAAALYRRKLAPKLICTGGVGRYPPAEARAAATLAEQQGVPAGDILLEERSTSTWENAQNAAAICREHGWRRVIVVSDPYHLWRARRDFALAGIEAYPSPAKGVERNRRPLLRVIWASREALSVVRDVVEKRARRPEGAEVGTQRP